METPRPSLEGQRPTIGFQRILGVGPILGVASTYLAARYVGAWAAGIVSGFGFLAIVGFLVPAGRRAWAGRSSTFPGSPRSTT